MSTTDRAAFEQYAESQGCRDFEYDQDDSQRYRNPFTQREYKYWRAALDWQAATEAAKATGAAGELFGYGSSEKKNCLLSKAQYDSCAPKNRTAYDIPLYAHSLPKCEGCKGYGVITHVSGQTPDNYQECNEECPECQGTGEAARQPAPVADQLKLICAGFGWRTDGDSNVLADRIEHHIRDLKAGIKARDTVIAERDADLAATAAPVLSDDLQMKLKACIETCRALEILSRQEADTLLAATRSKP